MKKLIVLAVTACLLFTACGGDGSSASGGASSSRPSSSSAAQPTATPKATAAPTATPQKDASSSSASPSSSEVAQDVSAWVGDYAKQPGSAGQILLTVTEGGEAGLIHFVLDAKGLTVEGDATVYKDGGALCEAQGNLTLSLGRDGVTVTEGKELNPNVAFSGLYEKF